MRPIYRVTSPIILACAVTAPANAQTAAAADAQSNSTHGNSSSRAGLRLGYGGHGLDWETSIDSPLILAPVSHRGYRPGHSTKVLTCC